MIKLLKTALQVGVATVPYPFVQVQVAPAFRGKPVYDFKSCISCGACAKACPPNAISLSVDMEQGTSSWSIFYGRCIFCGRCEEVCPTGAITLSHEFELTSFTREDLITRADFKLKRCSVCDRYFMPSRELAYVLALMTENDTSDEAQNRRSLLEVCPDCKRRLDVDKMKKAMTLSE
jgi:hydrogenase-4 component H